MSHRRLLIAAMAILLCTSVVGPAVAAGTAAQETADAASTENDVSVTTGAQLATIVTATSDEVRTEFENAAFDERLEDGNDSDRANAIAERAAVLENRSQSLQAEYDRATSAYEAGDIDRSTYAQRLASLNARAQGVVSSYDRLEERARSVDEAELRAAGVTLSELADERAAVAQLTSAGTDALLRQFTGEERGSAEIEIDGGVSIEVETDDGERSREYERPRDGNGSLAISQTDALAAASDALSTVDGNSSWVLVEGESDADDGVYTFEFVLNGTETGEAEVSVDGETGTVFELEETIGTDRSDDEYEDDDSDRLTMLVASGSPAPGEEVTLQVLENGEPAADVTVTVNEQVVGKTDSNGTITVTLPRGDVKIEADDGSDDAELEYEFGDDSDDDADSRFDATATIDNGTVTVTVTYNGSPVSGATVVANDEHVGPTGDNGTVSFTLSDDAEELDVEVTYGDLETELEREFGDDDSEDEYEGDSEYEDDDSSDGDDSEYDDDSSDDE